MTYYIDFFIYFFLNSYFLLYEKRKLWNTHEMNKKKPSKFQSKKKKKKTKTLMSNSFFFSRGWRTWRQTIVYGINLVFQSVHNKNNTRQIINPLHLLTLPSKTLIVIRIRNSRTLHTTTIHPFFFGNFFYFFLWCVTSFLDETTFSNWNIFLLMKKQKVTVIRWIWDSFEHRCVVAKSVLVFFYHFIQFQ